MMENKP
jgi:hypothetical protein